MESFDNFMSGLMQLTVLTSSMPPIKKPSGGRPPFHGKRKPYTPHPSQPRKNERIRAHEVRVIGPDNKQIGVMQTVEALKLAQKMGLDLVEITATVKPPICRIIDFGKFMYEQSKKNKEVKSPSSKMKEVKFRMNIEQHDYETKLRHLEQFLHKGYKVKITLMLKGREAERSSLALELVKRAVADLDGMAHPDAPPKLMGRNITVTLTPHPAAKRKPRFMRPDYDGGEDDEDEDETPDTDD